MKRYFLKTIFSLAALLLMASCAGDENYAPVQPPVDGETTYRMVFEGSFNDYDAKRSTSDSWSSGDKIYIRISSTVNGVATYDGSEWSITTSSSLSAGNVTECEAFHFDGEFTVSGNVIDLNPSVAVYQDLEARCALYDGVVCLFADLVPRTARVRFVSQSNPTITLYGFRSLFNYDLSTGNFSQGVTYARRSTNNTTFGEGYSTEYFYLSGLNETVAVAAPGGLYGKSLPAEVATAGESGYITVPREGAMNDWEKLTEYGGYEFVDLGLPSCKLWATCNVGATTPEAQGNYYGWGEKTTFTYYSSSYSTTYNLSFSSNIQGNSNYDTASAVWGLPWVMPLKADFNELVNNCTRVWTTVNGVNGFRFTGPNGNTLFLPAAGYYNSSSRNSYGSYGYYWTADYYNSSSTSYYFYFYNNYVYAGNGRNRYYGQSVRAVLW